MFAQMYTIERIAQMYKSSKGGLNAQINQFEQVLGRPPKKVFSRPNLLRFRGKREEPPLPQKAVSEEAVDTAAG